ncbi:Hypothetical predicted protein [Octopus vulgaris]|uniref:Uncharacterized protein n=1 Tax=Octopus vulgaris TaxID=6645 RepID=A0AA36FID6_OCTVU|nr:Hypothetical predicted protein [Octopus vulgaris]
MILCILFDVASEVPDYLHKSGFNLIACIHKNFMRLEQKKPLLRLCDYSYSCFKPCLSLLEETSFRYVQSKKTGGIFMMALSEAADSILERKLLTASNFLFLEHGDSGQNKQIPQVKTGERCREI